MAQSAELFGNIRAGRELHDSICSLSAKLICAGMNDPAAVNLIRGAMESGAAPRDARWQARFDDAPRAVWSARKKFGGRQPQPGGETLESIRASSIEMEAIEWLWPDACKEASGEAARLPPIPISDPKGSWR